MKLIDHTPYLSGNGDVSFLNQMLASLKFGSSWYPEIQAQKIVVGHLQDNLSKGYTLVRNLPLPGSDAVIPLILLGPAGVFVLVVTPLKGTFQAKADTWGELVSGKMRSTPANLLVRASRMARAIQRYLQKQGNEVAVVDAGNRSGHAYRQPAPNRARGDERWHRAFHHHDQPVQS